ncbi:unnamed protein product [Euphydryas editha]|uniref:Reverse transcriptase domain-containing protein n=1 Tax=Euphydryas editha TaxID=104508 RepID=A0AAU9TJ86_EUPED|nr:unnamed protein product [Euphydryas editha]
MSGQLTIYYQNVRGIRTKLHDVYKNVLTCNYQVIIFTETWLNDNIFTAEILDDRYQVFRRDRQSNTFDKGKEGGGVLIAVLKSFSAFRNTNLESSCEDLWVTIDYVSKNTCIKINVCAIYLPPPVKIEVISHFTNELQKNINNLDNVLLIGDFNLSRIEWIQQMSVSHVVPKIFGGDVCSTLIDFTAYACLKQYNNIKNKQQKTLDLVFSNTSYPLTVTDPTDILSGIDAYHPPIQINLAIDMQKPLKPKTNAVLQFYKADYNRIRERLLSVDWDVELDLSLTVDEITQIFYNIINNIIHEEIPKKRPIKNGYPAWYGIGLIKILKEKERHRIAMKKFNNKLDEYEYNLLKKRCRILINESYSKYIRKVQTNVVKDPKHFWSYIKAKRKNESYIPRCMKLNNEIASDGEGIANLFCRHFSSVYTVPQASSHCHAGHVASAFDSRCLTGIHITRSEIETHLKRLNTFKGHGSDCIPPIFFSKNAEPLAIPLQILFNKSLKDGVFPSVWKEAIVVPIPKSGSKQLIENYRPISLLTVLAKVFEKIISRHITWHTKQILGEQQHGFIAKRSTATNLVSFVEQLLSHLGSGEEVDAIYGDLSKAFDKVDHNILLSKLKNQFYINGSLLLWFNSYLKNRKMRVVINRYSSHYCIPSSGVPQGSILGPILFGLFIDDIKYYIKHSEFQLNADDLKIFRVVQNEFDEELLQRDVNDIAQWCKMNSMTMNIDKCLHIKFSRKRNKYNSKYHIYNKELKRVEENPKRIAVKPLFTDLLKDLLPKMRHSHVTRSPFWASSATKDRQADLHDRINRVTGN